MSLKVAATIILMVFMGFFLLQNTEVVEIDFLFWSIQASRVLVYLGIFLTGVLVGWLGNSLHRWHNKK